MLHCLRLCLKLWLLQLLRLWEILRLGLRLGLAIDARWLTVTALSVNRLLIDWPWIRRLRIHRLLVNRLCIDWLRVARAIGIVGRIRTTTGIATRRMTVASSFD